MIQRILLPVFVLMLTVAAAPAAEIVVLGETPVSEFVLPDGSVLKNAFVWRRSSEGLMIIHDDGQHFLNFKLLPDEWKKVYLGESEVDAAVEPIAPPVVLDDRYKLAPVLEVVPGLGDEGVRWLLREDADDETRQVALTLALFHSFATNNRDMAKRFFLIIEERGYKIDAVKLEKIFNPCLKCDGKGEYEQNCPACEGSGECTECEGKGLDTIGLGRSKQDCKVCEGSGECTECEGEKRAVLPCETCRGRGQLLDRLYCEVNRDHLVRLVNKAAGVVEALHLVRDESTGVGAVLETLPELDPEAVAFYFSEDYSGAMDTNILVACVMQSMLKDRMQDADRFNLMVETLFPKNKVLDIEDYIKICGDCKAKGMIEQECPACKKQKKKGMCSQCEGKGIYKPELGAAKECEQCEGSGECITCKGSGTARFRCAVCEGRGRLFVRMRTEIKLELLVGDLNAYHARYLKNKETPESDEAAPSGE